MIFPTFLKSQAYQNCVFLLQVYHTCERPFQPHYLQQQQQQQSKKKVTIVEDNNTESSVWCEEANKKRTVYYCNVERGCTDCNPAKTRKKPMAVTDDKNLLRIWKKQFSSPGEKKDWLQLPSLKIVIPSPALLARFFLTKKFGDIRCTKTSRLSKIEAVGNYEQCKMYAYLETE